MAAEEPGDKPRGSLQDNKHGAGGNREHQEGTGPAQNGHHALLRFPHRTGRPRLPDQETGGAADRGAPQVHIKHGGSLRRGSRLPRPQPRPPLSRQGPPHTDGHVHLVLPLLHKEKDSRRQEEDVIEGEPRGHLRLHSIEQEDQGRPCLGGRPARPGRPDAGRRPRPSPGHQARRDPADRDTGSRLPPPEDNRLPPGGPEEIPPPHAEHPLHPPEGDNARGQESVRATGRRGDPDGKPDRPPQGDKQQLQNDKETGPPASHDQGEAVLPVPVRPGRRHVPLPHVYRRRDQRDRETQGPHVRLRRPDLRHRCARRRRKDPSGPGLFDWVGRREGRPQELRGKYLRIPGTARG